MKNLKCLSLIPLIALAAGSVSYGQSITAGFDDSISLSTSFTGNNDGEMTAVDQWGGIPGRGWTSPWEVITNGSSVRDKQVLLNGGPTDGEGKYVQFRMQATGKQGRRWINSRAYESYGDVDLKGRVMFEFLYRLDDTSSFVAGGAAFIDIKDGGHLYKNEDVTWMIKTSGNATKRWSFADGDGAGGFELVNSQMVLVEGDTYKFTILADPKIDSWGVAVDNLDDDQSQEVFRDLGFLNKRDSLAGRLNFMAQIQTEPEQTLDFDYSLDSIQISAGE